MEANLLAPRIPGVTNRLYGRSYSNLDSESALKVRRAPFMEALPKRAKEADVEARIVTPLLTSPEFLGIPHPNVRNKAYLYPKRIDKAAGKTSGYYPDFSVWDESLPLVVVEAKAPAVAAEVGHLE